MTGSAELNASGQTSPCLIVEDDVTFAQLAARVVREEIGEPLVAPTAAAAREAVAARSFGLVLLDNHLPDGRGADLFQEIARRNPDAPIIMITGVPDLADAVALTRNGLFDYLTKPVDLQALTACLRRAKLRLTTQTASADSTEWFGESPAMAGVMNQLRQAARHPASTVLFTGETGAGKDLAARILHQLTFPAGSAPFIAVNCAAIPADMFESELFGAERGAYTGAERRRTGLIGAAANGSLFLDEIAEVPLALQAKLLRVIEAREFRSLGSVESQTFNGRLIAATNKSLAAEVKAGRFREDLLYRLDVFAVELPPLRQRRADIPGLAELLLDQLARKYQRRKPLLAPKDLAALTKHDFPGNVRELRNVLERSLLKTPDDSQWLLADWNWLPGPQPVTAPATASAETQKADSIPVERKLSPIEEQEYLLIRKAMTEAHGGIRRSAAKLGMSPQALLRRLEKWPELRGEKPEAQL